MVVAKCIKHSLRIESQCLLPDSEAWDPAVPGPLPDSVACYPEVVGQITRGDQPGHIAVIVPVKGCLM